MSDPGFTQTIAELATSASPSVADADRARLLLFDYLAVASAGASTDSAQVVRDAVIGSLPFSNGDGAALIGMDGAASARSSALVNGTSAHSLELDDTHEPSSSHPGTVVWTALLAASAGVSPESRQFLDGAVIGYQVMASLGELLGPAELYDLGLHPTAVCGIFGATAAVARLRSADAGVLRRAFGIALSMCGGSMAYLTNGAWTKRLHSGLAASNGILAMDLAEAGFTGPLDAFEDPNGLMHICGGMRSGAEVETVLEHATELSAVHETSIKFHPCCRYMHGVMDLLTAYSSGGGRIDGVDAIDCGVLGGGIGLVGDPLPRKKQIFNAVDAQFSMPFGAALTLARGRSSLQDFDDAVRIAAELQPLIDKVQVHTSSELDASYPTNWAAEVSLHFSDGERVDLRTSAFRGSPGWPVERGEVQAKVEALLGMAVAERLRLAVDALGNGDFIGANDLARAARADVDGGGRSVR